MKASPLFLAGTALLFAIGFTVLIVRLHRVQVVDAQDFRRRFAAQSTRIVQTPGARGRILDRNGVVLAGNAVQRDLVCRVESFRHVTSLTNTMLAVDRAIAQATAALGLPHTVAPDHILRHLRQKSATPLVVHRDLDDRRLARLAERQNEMPAFDVAVRCARVYPRGSLAAHAIGHVGRVRPTLDTGDQTVHFFDMDVDGRSGLEAYYNSLLAGVPGETKVTVNARGFAARQEVVLAPRDGFDLETTLDAAWQDALDRALAGVDGAGVVLDARTGAVLALSSSPNFDPNHYQPGVPEFNRAVSGTYAPGSTIKPVVALAALECGWNPKDTLMCEGVYLKTRCTMRWGHGPLTLHEAIRESCNPFFLQLGQAVPTDRIVAMARAFGLGEQTGIDLGGEAAGRVEPWEFQSAMGQGTMLATPLQMAVVAAALGNGGRVLRPYLHARPSVAQETGRQLPASAGNLALVKQAMKDVVEAGSARKAFHPLTGGVRRRLRVDAGGKTGSAEKNAGAARFKNVWFIGFAPFDDPDVALAILVEHGDSGGATAAPRAYCILKRFYGEMEASSR